MMNQSLTNLLSNVPEEIHAKLVLRSPDNAGSELTNKGSKNSSVISATLKLSEQDPQDLSGDFTIRDAYRSTFNVLRAIASKLDELPEF